MRKPKVGDEWRLKWLPRHPIRRIEGFQRIWLKWNKWVPGVWFERVPKKTIRYCTVRQLMERGVLVKPAEQAESDA